MDIIPRQTGKTRIMVKIHEDAFIKRKKMRTKRLKSVIKHRRKRKISV